MTISQIVSARSLVAAGTIIAVAALAGTLYLYSKRAESPGDETAEKPRLAVLPFAWDSDEELTTAVRTSLQGHAELIAPTVDIRAGEAAVNELASRLGADAVLSGERVHAGRFEGVNVFLYEDGQRYPIWSAGRPHVSFRQYRDKIAREIANAVRARLEISPEDHSMVVPGPDALSDYLEGRVRLDEPRSAESLQQAAARFEAALRLVPDYAAALAGLCDTFVERSVLEGGERLLDDAERQCRKALRLAPDAPEALIAQGNLLRARGMLDEALRAFDKALKQDAYYPHAYLGLAEVHLAAYRRSESPDAADQAIRRAVQAAKIDPQMWQAPYLMGLIYHASGNTDGAIEAMETAKTLDANGRVLSRLGALYACAGDRRRAQAMYERAKKTSPEVFLVTYGPDPACPPAGGAD